MRLPLWQDTLDGIVKNCDKRQQVEIESIPITVPEIERINTLEGIQIKRLAFTLLCVAKYWDIVIPNNNHWVRTPDREVITMANINTSVQRQCAMMHDLRQCGMLTFRKRVDDLRVQVNYISSGDTALEVSDLRNIGNQYMMYSGAPYIQCEQCGLVVRRKSNSQKYCKDCASEIHIRKTVEAMTNNRAFVKRIHLTH